ncbi:hypothetical protein PVK06_047319 [Gossypium arboreum]|uniref:Aminotransferase-like plant mobile domain-containing protein n=1 Tax=Gossypium arboreum TaxID=29729 RepID=A0ABR0MD22_GOSAR|nr:hypothetical protein PVK06_047319 [Gossypium arboreum]
MLGGTKLDPPLTSVLVERWRPKIQKFHLPCGECTITLKDVSLQLDLSVAWDVVTRPVVSTNWNVTCEQLLGNVSNRFRGSRIEMRWLKDDFQTINTSANDVEIEQFACAFILSSLSTELEDIRLALDQQTEKELGYPRIRRLNQGDALWVAKTHSQSFIKEGDEVNGRPRSTNEEEVEEEPPALIV